MEEIKISPIYAAVYTAHGIDRRPEGEKLIKKSGPKKDMISVARKGRTTGASTVSL